MKTICSMYITMLPLILGGVANMVFTKTSFYRAHRYPIDRYRVFRDGKRVLGDHKTVSGFCSMIVFVVFFQMLWGLACRIWGLEAYNEWYTRCHNGLWTNVCSGFLTGLVYMLCELPNSFLKRRLGIAEGKTGRGWTGGIFFVIDQIDSLVGVFWILAVCARLSFGRYLAYLFLGAVTHIVVNMILHRLKIRKNI